jgi:hypothetical protein
LAGINVRIKTVISKLLEEKLGADVKIISEGGR